MSFRKNFSCYLVKEPGTLRINKRGNERVREER